MFATLARFANRYKYVILIGWIAVTAIFFLTSPSLSKVGVTDQSQFLPEKTESSRAREIIKTKFAGTIETSASSALIVVYNENGLTPQNMADAKALQTWMESGNGPDAVKTVTSVFDSEALRATLVSQDNTTMLIDVGFSVGAMDESTKQAVNEIRQQFGVHPETNFYLTGDVGFLQDLFDSVQNTIDRTTWVTIILVIVLLLIIYRSPVAAIVPLMSIGFSFLVARGIIGFIAQAGVPVSTVTDAFMVVTIFGVGTDYCLFIISRFREVLGQGDQAHRIEFTMARIGPIILASAVTVIIAFLCLSISQFGMTQTIGWALAIGIVIILIAGVTLVPALMAIFGRYLFWPAMKPKEPVIKPRRFGWAKTGEWIARFPVWFTVPIIVGLVLCYLALPEFTLSANILTQLPRESEATKGLNVIRSHFPMGELSPLTLIIQSRDGTSLEATSLKEIEKTAQTLSTTTVLSGVDYFSAPADELTATAAQIRAMGDSVGPGMNTAAFSSLRNIGDNLGKLAISYPGITGSTAFNSSISGLNQISETLTQLQTATLSEMMTLLPQLKNQLYSLSNQIITLSDEFRLHGDSAFVEWLKTKYFSIDGTAARINLLMTTDPFSDGASKMVPAIRDQVAHAVQSSGLTDVEYFVGGDAALYADMLEVSNEDLTLVLIVTSIGILAVIIILLRCFIAPLYMVATVLLNYGATLGITSWILQDIMGYDNLISMLPVIVFVMLAAVGADYNIFLVSRIREEAETRSIKEAVQHAVAHTGNVITSCGIILAGTFATLIFTDFPMVLEIGLAISIGVLVDTFLVRALLVPALAVLAGRWSWWPSALFRKIKKEEKS